MCVSNVDRLWLEWWGKVEGHGDVAALESDLQDQLEPRTGMELSRNGIEIAS